MDRRGGTLLWINEVAGEGKRRSGGLLSDGALGLGDKDSAMRFFAGVSRVATQGVEHVGGLSRG